MDKKEKNGPEIEPWEMQEPRRKPANAPDPDEAIQQIKRGSYRGLTTKPGVIILEFDGATYEVVDIGSKGIGISLPAAPKVKPGEIYPLKLVLQNESLELKGRIRHVSPADETNSRHCGIELLDMDQTAKRMLRDFVLKQRNSLFAPK